MDFSPEERRRILESQARATQQQLRAFGRKLFVGLCLVVEAVSIYGVFAAEDRTLRMVCVAFIPVAAVGLVLQNPLRALFNGTLRVSLPGAGALMERLGSGLTTDTERFEGEPGSPAVDVHLVGTSNAISPKPLEASQAAAVANLLKPEGAKVETRETHGLEGPPPQTAAAHLPRSLAKDPRLRALLPDASGEPAAAAPDKSRWGLLNWILFAVICVGLILAIVAVITLVAVHPATPAR